MSNGVICIASNACHFLLLNNINSAPLSCKQIPSLKNSSADANDSSLRASLVLVSILLYLWPSCNTMKIMGFKLKVVSCLNDYNRSIESCHLWGIQKSTLNQRLGGGALSVFISFFHPMSSSFLFGAQKGSLPNKKKPGIQIHSDVIVVSHSLTGIYFFWSSFSLWHSSFICCTTGHYNATNRLATAIKADVCYPMDATVKLVLCL